MVHSTYDGFLCTGATIQGKIVKPTVLFLCGGEVGDSQPCPPLYHTCDHHQFPSSVTIRMTPPVTFAEQTTVSSSINIFLGA